MDGSKSRMDGSKRRMDGSKRRMDGRKGREPPRIAKAELPRIAIVEVKQPKEVITKEQLLTDHKQHFDRIREVLTEEYKKQIEKEIDRDMTAIVADCVDCIECYGIGLHDCAVRCGKLYCKRTLRILEKIYGVTEMTFSTEPQPPGGGFPWRTLVFGPKADK